MAHQIRRSSSDRVKPVKAKAWSQHDDSHVILDGQEGLQWCVDLVFGGPWGVGLPDLKTVLWFGRPGGGKSTGAEMFLQQAKKKWPRKYSDGSVEYLYARHTLAPILERYSGTRPALFVELDDVGRGMGGRKTMRAQDVADDYNEYRHEIGRKQGDCGLEPGGIVVICATTQIDTGVLVDFRSNSTLKVVCSNPGDNIRKRTIREWLGWPDDKRVARVLDGITDRELVAHDQEAKSEFVFQGSNGTVGYLDMRPEFAELGRNGFWRQAKEDARAWEEACPTGADADQLAGAVWDRFGAEPVSLARVLGVAHLMDPEMPRAVAVKAHALHGLRLAGGSGSGSDSPVD